MRSRNRESPVMLSACCMPPEGISTASTSRRCDKNLDTPTFQRRRSICVLQTGAPTSTGTVSIGLTPSQSPQHHDLCSIARLRNSMRNRGIRSTRPFSGLRWTNCFHFRTSCWVRNSSTAAGRKRNWFPTRIEFRSLLDAQRRIVFGANPVRSANSFVLSSPLEGTA